MKGVFDSDQFHNRQSVVITEAIATGYVVVFGILTIITHISLLASISFEAYSYLTVCIFVVLLVGLGFKAVKRLEEIRIRDTLPLVVVLLAGGIAGWIVTHFQPIRPFGTLSLDDYYYLANPVYYIRNPGQALSFELHDYYSGQAPFTSASFYTAGAYQYIQAAFAYVLGVNFIQFAYLFVSAISGFMFPISIYLALTKVSRDALGAAIGTAVTLLITMLMGESERSPGSWIFSRVFQGKSIVVSTGIYLIIYFSLEYFKHGKTPAWVSLALTSAALAGMSTTAIMLLPVMAFILFVDYFLIVERAYLRSVGRLFMAGIRYLMSFGYLILFALYIAFVDSTQVAVHANQGYPLTLMGYVRLFFQDAPFPTTLFVLVIFSVTAILLTRNAVRIFVMGLVFLPFLMLNPWVSAPLIGFFLGVYFRMFYVVPLFLLTGITASELFDRSQKWRLPLRISAWFAEAIFIALLIAYFPTSVVKGLHNFQDEFSNAASRAAQQLISETPKGLMLAPYPLSSVIFSFDPGYPQMYVRPDISDTFLWKQGREGESIVRKETSDFLFGENPAEINQNYQAFTSLVRKYPEIEIIVINKSILRSVPAAVTFLKQNRFSNSAEAGQYIAFWK